MSRNYALHGMHFMQPELDYYGTPVRAGTEFPIYSYLIALLYKLFGLHDALGRVLSVILTAWSAFFLYRLVENRCASSRAALLSGLVMCSIPVHVYFTRTVQPESMALWGLIGFVYYLDRVLYRAGPMRDWLWVCLLGATGPLLKLPYLYLVAGLWAVFLFENPRLWRTRMLWVTPVFILGVTAAWYHYAKSAPAQVLPMGVEEHLKNLAPLLNFNLWKTQFISRFPELCSTYSGLLLGFIGAWTIGHATRQRRFWFGWWGITFLYILLCGQYGVIHQYTAIPWAPINAVFIAAGALTLWNAGQSPKIVRTLALILLIGIPVHAGFRIQHWYHIERTYLFRAEPVLAQISRPNDLVVTLTRESPVMLYYLNRYGYFGELPYLTPQGMDELLSRDVRFVVVPVDEHWTSRPEWATYFRRKARLAHADPEFLIYEL